LRAKGNGDKPTDKMFTSEQKLLKNYRDTSTWDKTSTSSQRSSPFRVGTLIAGFFPGIFCGGA